MKAKRSEWWTFVAVLIAAGYLVLGTGNLVTSDYGSLADKILSSLVAGTAAALVLGGLAVRGRRPTAGSAAVAVGVLPACVSLTLWWFLPAVAVGVISICVVVAAAADAAASRHAPPGLQPRHVG